MASSTCSTLTNLNSEQRNQNLVLKSKALDPKPAPTTVQVFPLLVLPPEVLHQIAADYYASLPPLTLTKTNLHLPLHALAPLSLSSPAFSCLPKSLYYQHATFTLACPGIAKAFAGLGAGKESVRRVRVLYGEVGGSCGGLGFDLLGYAGGKGDWVYTLMREFEALEEVTFVVEGALDGDGEGQLDTRGDRVGIWWSCVRDAVREGLAGRSLKQMKRGLVLRLEVVDGGSIWEKIGGDES
ncbi:unnamed protein product [Diplocarpon coronariae]